LRQSVFTTEHRRKDGSIYPVEARLQFSDTPGSQAYLAIIHDLSTREAAAAALKHSETRYQHIFEGSMDGFIETTLAGKIVSSNPAYRAILGYTESELNELTYQDITPSKWHDFEQALVAEQLLTRGFTDPYQKEYLRKDGSIVPVELRALLLRDEQGEPYGFWGIARDITGRKHDEEVLRRSHELLSQMEQLAQVGAWELELPSMRLTHSPEVWRIYETQPEAEITVEQSIQYYAPEARPILEASVQACISHGTPFDLELPFVTAKGRHLWVRVQGNATMVDGKAQRIVGAFQEITERKQSEDAIKESARSWSTTFNSMKEVIWVLDSQHRIVKWNQASEIVFPQFEGKFSGKYCYEVMHGSPCALVNCPVVCAQKSLCHESTEFNIGDQVLEVRVDPILGEDGLYVG
ncbi:MAG: PAS domain S-box protein, partial [Deltaproteobacteria bacterium]|nr:PAS domain S-box protein [Deltaproteobacteria bacterium]